VNYQVDNRIALITLDRRAVSEHGKEEVEWPA
jgi:hypothetical protein